jgi:hypothetical protein
MSLIPEPPPFESQCLECDSKLELASDERELVFDIEQRGKRDICIISFPGFEEAIFS